MSAPVPPVVTKDDAVADAMDVFERCFDEAAANIARVKNSPVTGEVTAHALVSISAQLDAIARLFLVVARSEDVGL